MQRSVFFLLLLLTACGPATTTELTPQPTAVSSTSAPSPDTISPDTIPAVDTSLHNVPLTEIYFDTFRATNRAVRLSDANPDLIHQLRDTIPELSLYPSE